MCLVMLVFHKIQCTIYFLYKSLLTTIEFMMIICIFYIRKQCVFVEVIWMKVKIVEYISYINCSVLS
jgi:hypothetical protein